MKNKDLVRSAITSRDLPESAWKIDNIYGVTRRFDIHTITAFLEANENWAKRVMEKFDELDDLNAADYDYLDVLMNVARWMADNEMGAMK
jgi:hypothetical protein